MLIDPPTLPRFQSLRRVSYALRTQREMRGQVPRRCNLCGFEGRFLPGGRPPRYDSKCPRCASVERHRLLALAIDDRGWVRPDDRVLHLAPEPAVAALLRRLSVHYVSGDLREGVGDLVLDVEHLDLPSGSVDVIVASHVLEHVDDAAALAEFHRVLAPGGRAVLFTPVVEGWATTYENPAVTTAEDRLLHFGQEDHVRYYGRDVRDRITAAGFDLSEYTSSPEQCITHGLVRGETAFCGLKTSRV